MRIALFVVLACISGYSLAGVQDGYFQCMDGLKRDSRFSSIANHLAVDGQGTVSQAMLNDKSRPDDQQKQAMTDWIDARAQCVNVSPTPSAFNLHMAFVVIVADLYNGQMTFGEFNKKWQALYKKETSANTHEKTRDKPAK